MKLAFLSPPVLKDDLKAGKIFRLAGLFAGYASLVFIPDGGWPPIFMLTGLIVVLTGLRKESLGRPAAAGKRIQQVGPLSEAAAGLAFLLCVQHGLLQAQTELARGNWLGAGLALGIVTPLVGFLGAGMVKYLSNRLFGSK